MTDSKSCETADIPTLNRNVGKRVPFNNRSALIRFNSWAEEHSESGVRGLLALDFDSTVNAPDAEPEAVKIVHRMFLGDS